MVLIRGLGGRGRIAQSFFPSKSRPLIGQSGLLTVTCLIALQPSKSIITIIGNRADFTYNRGPLPRIGMTTWYEYDNLVPCKMVARQADTFLYAGLRRISCSSLRPTSMPINNQRSN